MYGGQLSNNPFLADSAPNRYPDINAQQSPPPDQFTSWVQPQQQQQPQQQYGQYAIPQQPTSQFQPSSYFGQQLNASLQGSGYGYLQSQNTMASPQTYNPVSHQLQSPSYVAELDPYASIGQGWDGSTQQQQQQQQYSQSNQGSLSSPTSTTAGITFNGHQHPRDYIRSHKAEIEAWDAYAWKQLFNSFDALKDSWIERKKGLESQLAQVQIQLQYGGGGYYGPQIQQEAGRISGVMKDADSHADSVAASLFQIKEVWESYRQSGDIASKRRVREASNAALQGLPDWPPQQ